VATVAIGDIHGNADALDAVLEQVARELSDHDTVVFLGDYIDRGPDSRACIDRILQFRAESRAHVVTLLGNHEEWLLRTLHDPTRHSWTALCSHSSARAERRIGPVTAVAMSATNSRRQAP